MPLPEKLCGPDGDGGGRHFEQAIGPRGRTSNQGENQNMNDALKIGYVGLGNMGGALARRLQLTHPLQVFDLNPASVAALEAEGASAAADLPALARDCDIIFLCLPTSDNVHSAIFGKGGLIEGLKAGSMIVDQTTGVPAKTREMAAKLKEIGVDLIDAPVTGGRAGAQAGTISIIVGASDEQFGRIEPILKDISPNIFHTGGVGNGQVVKIVNNLTSFTQRLVTFEAITLAVKNGVAPEIAAKVMLSGSAQNGYTSRILPRVLKGDLNVGFTLGLTVKDLALATSLGEESGVPVVLGGAAKELYERAIERFGHDAQAEMSGVFFQQESGAKFIPE
jgi:3-hydroxyisobutyrate dehydrogenase